MRGGRCIVSVVSPLHRLECRAPLRRMEDQIRSLCEEILAERDEEKATSLIVSLRDKLHQYVLELRARFGAYPAVIERRTLLQFHERFPICLVCKESVELTTARTNEYGQALHDDCYFGILKATITFPEPTTVA